MNKKFNLNDSIKNKRHFSNNENPIFGQLMSDVQKDEVELARINFEIDKKVRQKFKSKASAEGKQMREILVKLIEDYLND
jgi:hypothetical protein